MMVGEPRRRQALTWLGNGTCPIGCQPPTGLTHATPPLTRLWAPQPPRRAPAGACHPEPGHPLRGGSSRYDTGPATRGEGGRAPEWEAEPSARPAPGARLTRGLSPCAPKGRVVPSPLDRHRECRPPHRRPVGRSPRAGRGLRVHQGFRAAAGHPRVAHPQDPFLEPDARLRHRELDRERHWRRPPRRGGVALPRTLRRQHSALQRPESGVVRPHPPRDARRPDHGPAPGRVCKPGHRARTCLLCRRGWMASADFRAWGTIRAARRPADRGRAGPQRPDTNRWNRGLPRSGAKVGSIRSHPGEREYGILRRGSSRSRAFSGSPTST